jgi:glutaredoxin
MNRKETKKERLKKHYAKSKPEEKLREFLRRANGKLKVPQLFLIILSKNFCSAPRKN